MQAFAFYFPLSVLLMLGAVAMSFATIHWFRQERHTGAKLMAVTVLVVLSITVLRMPLYIANGEPLWESFLHGGINALQTIGLDVDLDGVLETGAQLIDGDAVSDMPFHLSNYSLAAKVYIAYVILQYALSLLLCAFAVLQLLSRLLRKTFLRLSGQTVFFFTAMTEEAIHLARSLQVSLQGSGKRALLCFLSKEEELTAELSQCWQDAQLKYAIRLNDSLSHKLFPLFSTSVSCILCSPEEQSNIDLLSSMLKQCRAHRGLRQRHVNYFVFGKTRQAEQAIDALAAKYVDPASRGGTRLVCMLNPVENLAVHILDKAPLYEHTAPSDDGTTALNILIAGNTPLAERFLRNAYACGQMYGCRLSITVAAPDAEGFKANLYASAPLLKQAEHPVVQECGEIRFHLLPHQAAIADENLVKDAHYILLAYEADEDNIRAARRIKRIIEQEKLADPRRAEQTVSIVYVVKSAAMNDLCEALDPTSAAMPYTPCRMIPVGSLQTQNQTEMLFGHELLRRAFFLEQAYMGALDRPLAPSALQQAFICFMNSAYGRRSSVAAALHMTYRAHAKRTLELPPRQAEAALGYVEHRRWNAYMIMDGYCAPTQTQLENYFFKGDATHKCDALRLHPCMVLAKPGLTKALWDMSTPALDPLDELSRQVHQMLLKGLRALHVPVDLMNPKPEDKPGIMAMAKLLLDEADSRLAQRMSKALFTDFKQFDHDIVLATDDILRLAANAEIASALRLFWLAE